ncbi:MAG: HEPN domain-containing protein [Burkholderiales bacterium]|nr:HEPN domain-containing protein [Phycisphaerae bacterium]
MSATVDEWLSKAHRDLQSAERELTSGDPNFDLVCFLCQQTAEKIMKAVLISRQQLAPKTHDLVDLSRAINQVVAFEYDEPTLKWLTAAAVDYRYPGESADADDANRAFHICRSVRDHLLPLVEQNPSS